ncbi:MAG: efflux transporter outer membrane subunit [Bacteroidetes bacterium]|nr:efflux transporter outer membrane subunit [Bacteroidota bacterium]
MAPRYERPDLQTPTVFRGDTLVPDSVTVASLKWFDLFRDQTLRSLIDTALVNNNDLLVAAARIDQARAMYGVSTANRLPQLNASVGAQRQQYPEAVTSYLPNRTLNTFTGSMDVSYEADIWGKYASAQEAARRAMFATEAGRSAVITSVVAATAQAYLELVELHWELEISKRTATSRLGSLNLVKSRKEFGVANDLDVRQAEGQYYTATATIPDIERAIMNKENQINVLLGRNPSAVTIGDSLGAQLTSPALPAGMPSTLLQRRPDIIAAEENLLAANANIGVARAAFFPSISLTAGAGFFGRDVSNMFNPAGAVWNLGANALQPLFQGGRLNANLDYSYAVKNEAIAQYRKTVLTAMEEVSNSIVNYRKYGQVRAEQEKLVNALRSELKLANLRYEGGYTSYLQVLDSQRSLFQAELELARIRLYELRSAVQLYKALGGGWQ